MALFLLLITSSLIYFGRSLDAKGKNNPMALTSAWVYWFKLKYQLGQGVHMLGIYFYGVQKQHIEWKYRYEPGA